MRGETIDTPDEVLPDLNLSSKSRTLLNSFQSREITLDEFLTECAYWAIVDGFDDIRPRPIPTKPDKATEIESFDLDTKMKFDYIKCYEKFPELKKYYDDRRMIINKNRADYEWLKEMLKYIPVQDLTTREKIEQKILQFKYFYNH